MPVRARRTRFYPLAALRRALRAALNERADPAKAPGMQAYMKSDMPCLGVQTPALRALCREVFAAHPLRTQARWLDTILSIWRRAEYREERYAAITSPATGRTVGSRPSKRSPATRRW